MKSQTTPDVVGRWTQTSSPQTADAQVETTPPPGVVEVACQTDPEVPSKDGTSQTDGKSKTRCLFFILIVILIVLKKG